jgi:hypothetical protein
MAVQSVQGQATRSMPGAQMLHPLSLRAQQYCCKIVAKLIKLGFPFGLLNRMDAARMAWPVVCM